MNSYLYYFQGYMRFPKMELPTRTRVAPSSMAASKLSLIPIDNTFSILLCPLFRKKSRYIAYVFSKYFLYSSFVSQTGAIVISPATSIPSNEDISETKSKTSSGATPPLFSSRPILISQRTLVQRPASRLLLEISLARRSESQD